LDAHVFKPVAKKAKSVPVTLPEEFCTTQKIVGDPLTDMPSLSLHPTDFILTSCYNKAAHDIIDANHPGSFLLPEERKLMHHFIMIFECEFAWDESQKGRFHEDFFPPIKIPVIPHVPCVMALLFSNYVFCSVFVGMRTGCLNHKSPAVWLVTSIVRALLYSSH